MITHSRMVYRIDHPGESSKQLLVRDFEFSEREALMLLVVDLLEQAAAISMTNTSILVRLELGDRVENHALTGSYTHVRSLISVAAQYLEICRFRNDPRRIEIGSSVPFRADWLNGPIVDGQDWRELAYNEPLRVAVARGLCPYLYTQAFERDCLNIPLDELIKRLHTTYEMDLAEQLKKLDRETLVATA